MKYAIWLSITEHFSFGSILQGMAYNLLKIHKEDAPYSVIFLNFITCFVKINYLFEFHNSWFSNVVFGEYPWY